MTTSSALRWSSQSYNPLAPGLADQVAMLLAAELQIMVAITGPDDGRMTGFLADLTHATSKGCTVLRLKVTLTASELFQALAGQLNVSTEGLDTIMIAARVGQRLSARAPKGHYVLLCEGAHAYSPGMLEVVRQLSNYPINIVLVGRRGMLGRFQRLTRGSLNQRINYQLDMSGAEIGRWLKTAVTAAVVATLAYFGAQWLGKQPSAAPPAPPPQRITAVTPSLPPEAPATLLLNPDSSLHSPFSAMATGEPSMELSTTEHVPLVLERELATSRATASH